MRQFTLRQGDLYFGDHEIGGLLKNTSDAQEFLDKTLCQILGERPEYKEYIDLYGQIHRLERYASLAAHGDTSGKWVYFDREKEYAVQSWINEVDGKYSGLLLCVCNPGSHTPKSKKSILVVPDSNIDFTGMYAGRDPIFSLLVPRIGELDSSTIGYELEQLRKQ